MSEPEGKNLPSDKAVQQGIRLEYPKLPCECEKFVLDTEGLGCENYDDCLVQACEASANLQLTEILQGIKRELGGIFAAWQPDKYEDRDSFFTWQSLKGDIEQVFSKRGING